MSHLFFSHKTSVIPNTYFIAMIVDDTTAYIMTANFTLSALGGTTSTTNREYGIIVSDANVLNTVQQTFLQDWKDSRSV
jgi:phosphatidylserine/phosphatidylglycerophosphate/cardiolipin synthase-like enzyme